MARGNRNANQDTDGPSSGPSSKRRTRTPSGAVADWQSCNTELLAKAIASVARHGAAIRLGYTRDGGAYAIGFYDGDDKHTEYVRPGEDLDGYLREVIEDYTG